MNKYLDQVCVTASMVKQAGDNKNELRDTGVIGAMGIGTGMISNHINNTLGHNGEEAKAAAKSGTSLIEKARSFMKSPGSTIGSVVRTPGFKTGLKIGAVGGAIGLVGDYAAVKINKALSKQASDNRYVTYIAQNMD